MVSERTKERARQILPHLVRAAQDRRTMTYKQLAAKIGSGPRVLSRPLAYIRDHLCADTNRPPLNCLVVNGKTHLPGSAWLPQGASHLTAQENRAAFERDKRDVFAYADWPRFLAELGLKPV